VILVAVVRLNDFFLIDTRGRALYVFMLKQGMVFRCVFTDQLLSILSIEKSSYIAGNIYKIGIMDSKGIIGDNKIGDYKGKEKKGEEGERKEGVITGRRRLPVLTLVRECKSSPEPFETMIELSYLHIGFLTDFNLITKV